MDNSVDSASKVVERLVTHEVKSQPSEIPETKIVSAYGLRKCYKLVEQIAGESLQVRINALEVLCDEMQNPYSIFSCTEAGVVPVLGAMISDPDFETRLRSSRALAIMAKDANGLDSILHDEVVSDILVGKDDPSVDVRFNVFECLLHVSRTADGVDACNAAGATKAFVEGIKKEQDNIKGILLQALYNASGSEIGLVDALNSGAVKVCIDLLGSKDFDTQVHAARTLGFICFDERGKTDALEFGAVTKLLDILRAKNNPPAVKGNLLMALMSITSTDEGKRLCNVPESINDIVTLLIDPDRVVKLNVLKLISNISVFPAIRTFLLKNTKCSTFLVNIRDSQDTLLKRHAQVAINAINWKP